MVQVQQCQDGVEVVGFLDVRGAAVVRQALRDAFAGTTGDVHLDVSGVDAIDVTGLALIVAAHRQALRENRRLVIVGVRPSLARVFAVTRLHRVLAVARPTPAA
jgi:anti-anti-sigma factor